MKCPKCGKFVRDAIATINGFDEIERVDATCAKHGKVQPTDWEWEDFCANTLVTPKRPTAKRHGESNGA